MPLSGIPYEYVDLALPTRSALSRDQLQRSQYVAEQSPNIANRVYPLWFIGPITAKESTSRAIDTVDVFMVDSGGVEAMHLHCSRSKHDISRLVRYIYRGTVL